MQNLYHTNMTMKKAVIATGITALAACAVIGFSLSCWGRGELTTDIRNGYIREAEGNPLPGTIRQGKDLKVSVVPVFPGYKASKLTVRYGRNFDGPQYVDGERQWRQKSMKLKSVNTIPTSMTGDDVRISADFRETSKADWTLVWADEFDGDSVSMTNWYAAPRWGSRWDRYSARDAEFPVVNKVENGVYKAYAIATPEQFKNTEKEPFISGCLKSHVGFTGGRIEARARTRIHRGNSPAFWLRPFDMSLGSMESGEIDIWEQFDDKTRAHQTIHDGWIWKTKGAVSREAPAHAFNIESDPEEWHVYAVEWDPKGLIRWLVDNKEVFRYEKKNFSEGAYTPEITWPYDKPFYIIINQSLMDKDTDPDFTYLTEFDYVRVYQPRNAVSVTRDTDLE